MQPLENHSATLFEKYGAEALTAVVNEFYNRILSDPDVSHYFDGVDMNVLRKHQTMFVSYILGAKRPYTGAGLREAHANLNIREVDFERIIRHLDGACKHFNVELADRAHIMSYVRTLKYFIIKKQ